MSLIFIARFHCLSAGSVDREREREKTKKQSINIHKRELHVHSSRAFAFMAGTPICLQVTERLNRHIFFGLGDHKNLGDRPHESRMILFDCNRCRAGHIHTFLSLSYHLMKHKLNDIWLKDIWDPLLAPTPPPPEGPQTPLCSPEFTFYFPGCSSSGPALCALTL